MEQQRASWCSPCQREDHATIMKISCVQNGCGYKAKLCYDSLRGSVQQRRCPRHMNRDDFLFYSIQGLPSHGVYRAVPDPAQWRRCHRGCCGEPVRFTTYCLLCGFPEDLCASRLDKLRLPPHHGHNEYTHCPRCPVICGVTIIPATGYPEADWAQFEEAAFCVPVLLERAGAAGAWHKVKEFMQQSGFTTWGTFLSHFQQYIQHVGAEAFNQIEGHAELGRLCLGHIIVAEVHKLLFRRQQLCYEANYVNPDPVNLPQNPPHSFHGAQHSVPFEVVIRKLNEVVRQCTARTARAYKPLDMLVLYVLASLARPGRQTWIVRSDNGYMMTDSKLLGESEQIPSNVLAQAKCASMFAAGTCWLSEELRLMLESPTAECPDEGPFSDVPLPFLGPLFA